VGHASGRYPQLSRTVVRSSTAAYGIYVDIA